MTQQDVVNTLVGAAVDGMEAAAVETAPSDREVLSAAFTIALRTMKAALGRNELLRPACLEACQMLMMQVADRGHPQ